ncbi:hypothetical protein [Vreelandella sp. GE22]
MAKRTKSRKIAALNIAGSLAIAGATTYMLFAGFNVVGLAIVGVALISVAIPVAATGDSLLEILLGLLEALFEGIMAALEGIFNAICALFSW